MCSRGAPRQNGPTLVSLVCFVPLALSLRRSCTARTGHFTRYPALLALVLLAAQTGVEEVLQASVAELAKVQLGGRALLAPDAVAAVLDPDDERQLAVLSCLVIGALIMGLFLALAACSSLFSWMEPHHVAATGVRERV